MKHLILFLSILVSSTAIADEEIEHSTITSCAYQAGTAREIQTIRQVEGDEWPQFEQKIKKIYKDTQGRYDLLAIGKIVYLEPLNNLPDVVYEHTFSTCVKHAQGRDKSA
ncbi:hypothetical protein LCGC14_1209140 [marine sediment metagenome]|uniref:Uncharacterized protein n=1 Tax=marine sediment metagenome TaxID=412755 RepID=A0A0F9LIW7_9ZZZZ|nr:hypothetical protein [Methylophaga sp.]